MCQFHFQFVQLLKLIKPLHLGNSNNCKNYKTETATAWQLRTLTVTVREPNPDAFGGSAPTRPKRLPQDPCVQQVAACCLLVHPLLHVKEKSYNGTQASAGKKPPCKGEMPFTEALDPEKQSSPRPTSISSPSLPLVCHLSILFLSQNTSFPPPNMPLLALR